jgi:hypothetical protein
MTMYGPLDVTVTVHYDTCADCNRRTSYLVFRPATSDWLCAWCQHRKDRANGVKNPWPLPNLYMD